MSDVTDRKILYQSECFLEFTSTTHFGGYSPVVQVLLNVRFLIFSRTRKTDRLSTKEIVWSVWPCYTEKYSKSSFLHHAWCNPGANGISKHGNYRFYGQNNPRLWLSSRLMTLYIRDRLNRHFLKFSYTKEVPLRQ